MKIRASYGEVGNDRLGASRRYYYLPNTYYLNQGGYYLGNNNGSSPNTYFSGATEGVLGNPDITWERSRKYDVGVAVGSILESSNVGAKITESLSISRNISLLIFESFASV